MPAPEAPGLTRRQRTIAVALVTLGTFTDLLAYSIAVPVLPDLSRQLGASPTMVGFLFASFGVTLLAVSVPVGALSDRVGRRLPLVAGMAILAASTLALAFARSLPWLFAARLMQGAADAITWGVGFALVADLYGAAERGRVMGLVMSGSNLGFMLGPSIGGWLYEMGGPRLPFLAVATIATAGALGFLGLRLSPIDAARDPVPFRSLVRHRDVAVCALLVAIVSATLAMFEPVLALHLSSAVALSPGRIGLVFGAAAVASTVLNPLYGRLADRFGSRGLMILGLVAGAAVMPLVGRIGTFGEALAIFLLQAATLSLVVTPSLTHMAEAGARAGAASFGVSYGLYNFAWGGGLLAGPAVGGAAYERFGFRDTLTAWPALLVVCAVWFALASRPKPIHIPVQKSP